MIYVFPEYENFDISQEYIEGLTDFMDKILKDFEMKNYAVNLVFCDDEFIKELNKKYRGVSKPTDVLSFSQIEGEAGMDDFDFADEEIVLGDIIISVDTMKSQAKKEKVPLTEELARLAIHGLLHLLGFDHEKSEDDACEMFELQEKYLEEFLKLE
jgi:probable rRNA maturation factor